MREEDNQKPFHGEKFRGLKIASRVK